MKTVFLAGATLLGLATVPAHAQQPVPADTARRRTILTPEAVVTATRATDKTGTTYQNVSREQLQARNFGQDIPYLLDQTPSVVTTSDAGTGVGYTGIRIRGTDGTRINVTLNGVPVNEAESHGVFFVDLPDLASSTQSIQVQRGAGPSTNGAGAFGASLNVETLGLRPKAYAEVNNSVGSFGTWKSTIMAGTGLINGHFTVDARASRVQSEGYVDRGWSRLKSLYLTGTYSDEKTLLRALVLTGYETTYQSWFGLADSLLHKNRRYNESGTDAGQHLPAYKNQTDNYQQDYYQFLISRQLSKTLNLSVTPFWTRGGGYYEEYKANQEFEKYGISGPVFQPNAVGSLDTLTTTDVIRRRWLKTDLYGATYALQLRPSSGLVTEATLGGAFVGYRGQHFDELTWAQRGLNIPESGTRYADEPNAHKTDINVYARANVSLTEKLGVFGDLQYRTVRYELFAPDSNAVSGKSQQAINFQFLNPKAGLTYQVSTGLQAYASFAVARREPTRTDYTDTPASRRPTSETLYNYEAGVRHASAKVQASLNYYYMAYRNQLVLSGRLDDVGNAIHTNVADSYRTGVEAQVTYRPVPQLSLTGTATASRNKINHYTDYLAIYNEKFEYTGDQPTAFTQTNISFSPDLTASYTVEYEPVAGLKLAALARYASRQYLDNTSTASRSINPYYVQDVRLRYLWHPASFAGLREVELAVLVNNVFATEYVNNGYTYGYVYGGQNQYFNYFYPQAKTNFLASLNLRF
ncbi:TonB-dependent receptor [Hymenobacter negativus]|uniref:TonB-dependent receptor n=1 Tax=Hymenobacter negativus TaxID=2795026 RepID=A0ABS3QGZ3_9BACT|nr:TonB-dependent receptor [Hymenobacter negativus]MBO2010515.1 TonB-dependent receptor [Hymenobacter negativus]